MSSCIMTARMMASCDRCARPAIPVHMPPGDERVYCPDCCPYCAKEQERAEPGSPVNRY